MEKLLILTNAIAIIVIILWVYFALNWSSISTLIIFIETFIALFKKNDNEEELIKKLKYKLNNRSLSQITILIKKLDTRILRKIRGLNTDKVSIVVFRDFCGNYRCAAVGGVGITEGGFDFAQPPN